jgi:hypothetical protein
MDGNLHCVANSGEHNLFGKGSAAGRRPYRINAGQLKRYAARLGHEALLARLPLDRIKDLIALGEAEKQKRTARTDPSPHARFLNG